MPILNTKNYKEFTVVDSETGVVLKTFTGAKNAGKCLPGDSVDITETGCKLVSRAVHPIIAGLLELNSKVKFGYSGRNVPIYMFVPFNESYPQFVVGCSEKDTSVNRLGLIRFEGLWDEGFPRGILQRLLAIDAEAEALFWTYSPLACEKYKGSLPPIADLSGRRELGPGTFHIDPVGCKDVDDVLTFDGEDCVIITIADVSATVPSGHELDLRAARIIQTFYQDGAMPKHMFPAELSEMQMSLLSGAKPGFSLRVCLKTMACSWFESVVRVEQTFTYESIYEDVGLCSKLRAMSAAFGLDSNDSHKWIEAAMKFYNIQAAKLLKSAGYGVLRSHKAPDIAKLDSYTQIDPSLSFLAMNSASYVSGPYDGDVNHWGLGLTAYTHATSPIRRYADLINQRALKVILFSMDGLGMAGVDVTRMNAVGKAAKQHDRDYVFLTAIKKSLTGFIEGKLITVKEVEEGIVKLSFFVPEWGLVVRTKYNKGVDLNTVVSKDETLCVEIAVGSNYRLSYHADLRARSWKKRVILRLETRINHSI
jgi:hypothetical protein